MRSRSAGKWSVREANTTPGSFSQRLVGLGERPSRWCRWHCSEQWLAAAAAARVVLYDQWVWRLRRGVVWRLAVLCGCGLGDLPRRRWTAGTVQDGGRRQTAAAAADNAGHSVAAR